MSNFINLMLKNATIFVNRISASTGIAFLPLCVIGIIAMIVVEKMTKNLISVLCTAAVFVFLIIMVSPFLR